jgi:cell surface protein SprA
LDLTPEGIYSNENAADRMKVWLEQNTFDFDLQALTDAKLARNRAKRAGNSGVGNTIPYEVYDPEDLDNKITVMGNPTLEDVQAIMIGIRNKTNKKVSGEVWVNELRLSQFNEQGGVAAMGNAALSISDIAQVNVAGRLETAGYGSIESNVLSRNMDDAYQISVSAALEAGRLFPEKAKLQIPLYVSYSNETTSPDYDPLDTDVKLSETLELYETKEEKDSIRLMANTVHESTSFSVSNMKVDRFVVLVCPLQLFYQSIFLFGGKGSVPIKIQPYLPYCNISVGKKFQLLFYQFQFLVVVFLYRCRMYANHRQQRLRIPTAQSKHTVES